MRGSGLKLSVFTGADYAVVSNNRRSVSDVAVVLGDAAISWKTSTQKCMTTAACEAQYVTYYDAETGAIFERADLVFCNRN